MATSYTDFHIDFGGTSVWYHVVTGKKRFFLVAPTPENLKAYEQWTCSVEQDNTFFGDFVPNQCFYVDLCAGQTMMIPSAWIHSVYTPEDSLVFGGNFLHSFSIYRQLQAHMIEERTRVSKMYRFPYFRQISFYALCWQLSIVARITNHFEETKLAELTYLVVFGSKAVYQQFPYLVKACEVWLETSCLEDVEKYEDAAGKAGFASTADVITLWWNILTNLAENEKRNQNEDEVLAGASIHDIRMCTSMPDFLSAEHTLRALLPVETDIDWAKVYRDVMQKGNFKSGCTLVAEMNSPIQNSGGKNSITGKCEGGKDVPRVLEGGENTTSTGRSKETEFDVPKNVSPVVSSSASQLVSRRQRIPKQKAYKTRGKRLSASFLRENTDIEIQERDESEEEEEGEEEDEVLLLPGSPPGSEGSSGLDETDDEELLDIKRQKRTKPPQTSRSASTVPPKKTMSIRQNIKQILKKKR